MEKGRGEKVKTNELVRVKREENRRRKEGKKPNRKTNQIHTHSHSHMRERERERARWTLQYIHTYKISD